MINRSLKTSYQSLNTIEVYSNNLISNYKYFKNLNPNLELFPNLKSNAYGHGIIEVARILDSLNTTYFVVDSLFEAYGLLKAGIKTNVLIHGFVIPENLNVKKLPFSYAVWSNEQIEEIMKYQPHAKLHLFIDSGMNREGILLTNLYSIEKNILKYKNNFEGIMSHFASADDLKSNQSNEQLLTFLKAINYFNVIGIDFKYKHISASGGQLTQDNSQFNAARLGLGLYGISPLDNKLSLKPALSFKSKLTQIKSIPANSLVGYSATFKSKKEMRIGIIPAGYNDGIDRRLSNKGKVKVNNIYCDIIGRVSMNITTIDLNNVEAPYFMQDVEIYSASSEYENSIENSAKLCDTIPYDLLVHLNNTTKRIVNNNY